MNTVEQVHVKPKSLIRWVGGKAQLLPELQKRMPKTIGTYFEPFIGGGALMWSLDRSSVRQIVINDYNTELTNLYEVVKAEPDKLIKHLARHRNTEKYYYEVRGQDRTRSYSRRSPVTKASRFIFLNKTSFNGVYSEKMPMARTTHLTGGVRTPRFWIAIIFWLVHSICLT